MKGRTVNNGEFIYRWTIWIQNAGNHCQHPNTISPVLRICLMNSMGVRILLSRRCRWRCQQTIEIRSWPRVRLAFEAQQGLLQSGGWFR